jgi:hypothetical protein
VGGFVSPLHGKGFLFYSSPALSVPRQHAFGLATVVKLRARELSLMLLYWRLTFRLNFEQSYYLEHNYLEKFQIPSISECNKSIIIKTGQRVGIK